MVPVRIAVPAVGLAFAATVLASHIGATSAPSPYKPASPGIVLSAPIDAAHTSRAQILKLVEGPLADRAERIDVQFGSYVPNWTIITGHAQAKERDDCWVVTLHNVVDSGGTCMIAPAGGTMKEGPRRAVPNFCNIAYIIDDKTGQIVEGIPYA